MERLIDKKLRSWKESPSRKPLIIRGARQVGKSYSIVNFGKKHFSRKIHVVDFEKYPDWAGIFMINLDPVRIISELEILLNERIIPGKDLLFFDEIQAAPRALMALRYFYEEMPDLHVIAAGSLLEFAMKDISFPVGRVEMMNLTPMNFYEFLIADSKRKAAELIISKPEPLSVPIHDAIMQSLRQYMFTGGMPECVNCWVNTQSMAAVFKIQSSLAETFRADFGKYAPYSDKRSLLHTLNAIAKNIGCQVIYSRLSEDFTSPTNKKAFELLSLAKLISKVSAASPASLPFSATASEKKFKAIIVDIGLMRALHDLSPQTEFTKNDLLSMYHGAMAEQFVGQEFHSDDSGPLYYWARNAKNSSAEVDYLIVKNNRIFPVEVKSGAAGKLRSLHLLLKEYPNIEQAYVLSGAPYGHIPEQRISFLPVYYAYSIANQAI